MTRVCKIEGCSGSVQARGLCQKHYTRWRLHGDPLSSKYAERGDHFTFLKEAAASDTDDCILWPYKSKHRGGYGSFLFNGRQIGAHRFQCTAMHGQAPLGAQCAHSCGISDCVNPRHLRWATPKENQADRLIHGTDIRGEAHGNAKLSEFDVHAIKRALQSGETHQKIADRFNVSRQHITAIATRRKWSHLDGVAA